MGCWGLALGSMMIPYDIIIVIVGHGGVRWYVSYHMISYRVCVCD